MAKNLTIDTMIMIDETGAVQMPTNRQLIDADIKKLYDRDTTSDKSKFFAECGVIYQCGDPKSHAKQQGLSNEECLKFAINMYALPRNYKPDLLVLKLINRYYEENITEAGKLVENILQSVHNMSIVIKKYNGFLNELITDEATIEGVQNVVNMIISINKIAGDIPNLLKDLETAKQHLMYETQTESGRGGTRILSSMDAEQYDN